MSDLPDWIYPDASVVIYDDRAPGRRDPCVRKVLRVTPKTFTVEGANSVSTLRFQAGKLSVRTGGSYGYEVKVEQPGTLLADELLAERAVTFRERHAVKAAESFRIEPSVDRAEKVIQLLKAYQTAQRLYEDCRSARRDAER